MLTTAYGVTNLSSVVLIVVANKMVLFTHKFAFAVTLTWLHAVFTAVGMAAMAGAGVFERKAVSWRRTAPIAAVYVGFVVLNNLSIQLNPLGEPARRPGQALRAPGSTATASRRQGGAPRLARQRGARSIVQETASQQESADCHARSRAHARLQHRHPSNPPNSPLQASTR
jgi:hypothetical protein